MKQVGFGDAKENLYRFSGGGSVGGVAPAICMCGILCESWWCRFCVLAVANSEHSGVGNGLLAGYSHEEGFAIVTYLNPYF